MARVNNPRRFTIYAGSIPARATMATKEGTKIQQGASPYEETAWPSMLKWME